MKRSSVTRTGRERRRKGGNTYAHSGNAEGGDANGGTVNANGGHVYNNAPVWQDNDSQSSGCGCGPKKSGKDGGRNFIHDELGSTNESKVDQNDNSADGGS